MAKCPACNAAIDLADVNEYDKTSATQKYFECPVCHAHLNVYLKIDYITVAEEEEGG